MARREVVRPEGWLHADVYGRVADLKTEVVTTLEGAGFPQAEIDRAAVRSPSGHLPEHDEPPLRIPLAGLVPGGRPR